MTCEIETKNFTDYANPKWFKSPVGSSVWITGYRANKIVNSDEFETKFIDLEYVRLVILNGTINYLDASNAKIEILQYDQFHFDVSKIAQKSEPPGFYVLFLLPFDTDGAFGDEALTRDRIRDAVGLLATLFGKNFVSKHLFDNVTKLDKGETSAFSEATENPHWFPAVDANTDLLKQISNANSAICKLQDADRNRVYLCLRWLQQAIYDLDHIIAFIKFWIAIETLTMDGTDIRPICDLLGIGYGMSSNDAKKHFNIDRIFGMRSAIVHGGKRLGIDGNLLLYLEAIVFDLISIKIGLPFEKRAEQKLRTHQFDVSAYLRSF